MELADQYRAWAEELVDLTAVNDLINFKPTKTTTIYPLDEAVDRLLKGESLLLSEISDFTDEINSKASRSVIGKAKENFDQFGLKTLKLASGFASWNSDLLSNTCSAKNRSSKNTQAVKRCKSLFRVCRRNFRPRMVETIWLSPFFLILLSSCF